MEYIQVANPKTLKQWLIPKLRAISRYWPAKNQVINDARVKVKIGHYKNGNPIYKTLIECNICKQTFERHEIDVDHITPIANIEGFKDWNSYVEALFCSADGLQVACKSCHYLKTQLEKDIRKNNKKST